MSFEGKVSCKNLSTGLSWVIKPKFFVMFIFENICRGLGERNECCTIASTHSLKHDKRCPLFGHKVVFFRLSLLANSRMSPASMPHQRLVMHVGQRRTHSVAIVRALSYGGPHRLLCATNTFPRQIFAARFANSAFKWWWFAFFANDCELSKQCPMVSLHGRGVWKSNCFEDPCPVKHTRFLLLLKIKNLLRVV